MDVGMDLLFLHPRDQPLAPAHPLGTFSLADRAPSRAAWLNSSSVSSLAVSSNTAALLMIPIVILLAAMRATTRRTQKAHRPAPKSTKRDVRAICGSVQGDESSIVKVEEQELLLHVPEGDDQRIVLWRDASVPNLCIIVDKDAKLTLREDINQSGKTKILLREGASLDHIVHQSGGECPTKVEHQGGNSRYTETRVVTAGAGEALHSTDISIKGNDCVSDVNSIHVVTHEGGRTNSDSYCNFLGTGIKAQQTHRAVLCGRKSRSFWKSTYMVNKVAQQTDANQECKALILDKTARMSARPELRIQADDVKVTHGAALSTTIDPRELMYLESRGVSQSRARWLCINGFIEDTLEKVAESDDREWLREKVKEAISEFEN
ncbi:hypothetical protein FOL47_008355 [Perkinsus chesapeaki]|uniref:SUF system FeS cluster assembly SufBD core domain-containing protein n=1 Tax=Perkinsus chesapeaki TaxID=330153 RepID=A0A7J6MU41_PERCH|nr:hypothetical protein FOL47_008355 [Perkinsus chesapeaki]